MADTPGVPGTQYLAIEDGVLAFDDSCGDGPVVLALPGMGDLRSEYRYLRPALVEAGCRVMTMDVRGFGETSAYWADYSARAIGRDAVTLLDRLGVSSAVILGNSFAAGAALWAAQDAPARVQGVVLLGPIVRDQKIPALAKLVLWLGFAGPWRVWFWTTYWNSLFPSRKPSDQADAKRALQRNLREPGRMAALRTMIGLSKADTAAILSLNRAPTLVVMGSRDPDFSDAAAEADWLARTLGANRLIIEGAGHYPHTEMPEKTAPAILPFIHDVQAQTTESRDANQALLQPR